MRTFFSYSNMKKWRAAKWLSASCGRRAVWPRILTIKRLEKSSWVAFDRWSEELNSASQHADNQSLLFAALIKLQAKYSSERFPMINPSFLLSPGRVFDSHQLSGTNQSCDWAKLLWPSKWQLTLNPLYPNGKINDSTIKWPPCLHYLITWGSCAWFNHLVLGAGRGAFR